MSYGRHSTFVRFRSPDRKDGRLSDWHCCIPGAALSESRSPAPDDRILGRGCGFHDKPRCSVRALFADRTGDSTGSTLNSSIPLLSIGSSLSKATARRHERHAQTCSGIAQVAGQRRMTLNRLQLAEAGGTGQAALPNPRLCATATCAGRGVRLGGAHGS